MLASSATSQSQQSSGLMSQIPVINRLAEGGDFEKAKLANTAQGVDTPSSPATDVTKSISSHFRDARTKLSTGVSEIASAPSKIGDGKHGNAIAGLAKGIYKVASSPTNFAMAIPRGMASATLGKVGAAFHIATSPLQDVKAVTGKMSSFFGGGSASQQS